VTEAADNIVSLPMKACGNKSCKQVNPQPLSSFCKNKRAGDGLQHRCKACNAAMAKENQKKHPEKWAEYARRYRANNPDKHRAQAKVYKDRYPDRVKSTVLKRNFGIDIAQYNAMFEAQAGRCAICDRHASEFKKSLAVDHCHASGKVRSLLCHHCNTAIGLFQDDAEVLGKAIDYLARHS
jgi:hypothetical protein